MAEGIYKVEKGDTLWALARDFNTTVGELVAANPDIKDPNKIKLGQTLNIPNPPSYMLPSPPPKQFTPSGPYETSYPERARGTEAPTPPPASPQAPVGQPFGELKAITPDNIPRSYDRTSPSAMADPNFWSDFLESAIPKALMGARSQPFAAAAEVLPHLGRSGIQLSEEGLARMSRMNLTRTGRARMEQGRYLEGEDPAFYDMVYGRQSPPGERVSEASQAERIQGTAQSRWPRHAEKYGSYEPTQNASGDPTVGGFAGEVLRHILGLGQRTRAPGIEPMDQIKSKVLKPEMVRRTEDVRESPGADYPKSGPYSEHEKTTPFTSAILKGMERAGIPIEGVKVAGQVIDFSRFGPKTQNLEGGPARTHGGGGVTPFRPRDTRTDTEKYDAAVAKQQGRSEPLPDPTRTSQTPDFKEFEKSFQQRLRLYDFKMLTGEFLRNTMQNFYRSPEMEIKVFNEALKQPNISPKLKSEILVLRQMMEEEFYQ